MAARTISATQTLEEFRTEFNALSSQDFGDIATLDSGITATSVIGAVNELYTSISGSLGFDITDGSNTQTVSNTQTITFASTANQVTATVSATALTSKMLIFIYRRHSFPVAPPRVPYTYRHKSWPTWSAVAPWRSNIAREEVAAKS